MAKSGGTGKTKGKAKPVQKSHGGGNPPARRKEDTTKHLRARSRSTSPLLVLVVLPVVVLAVAGIGWYRFQYGRWPLFVTAEQRQQTLADATTGWDQLKTNTLAQWHVTKAQLQKMDQQFSVQYEAWQKDRDRRRQETEFLLDQQNSAAAPAQPARQEPVKMAMLTTPEPAWQGPPVGAAGTAAAPGHAIAPPVASGQPLTTPATPATPANSGTSVPPNQQTREKPATAEANHTGTPPPAGGTSTPPVQPNPPAAVWNPYDQTNYKAGAKQCEEAMAESKKGDDTNGQEAIGHYKAAIQKISTASDLWATVLQQALQNGAGVEGLRQNIADCDANRQVWEANIATIQKQMAAPKPATGGTAAPAGGAGSGEFYAGNAKWLAGKKEFKLGYDLFTDHISHGTGQASQVLNKYIDEAVEHFNKAEDLWSDAEQDWFKKFPGKSGPAADAKMMDDAMQESQFYRYACMKMHTF